MERTEYMVMVGECLDEDECMRLFERSKDELKEGTAVWNQSLEIAYNEYCYNEEADEDEDDGFDYEIAEGYASNMPCDNSGYCDPMHCPQFHECQGYMH